MSSRPPSPTWGPPRYFGCYPGAMLAIPLGLLMLAAGPQLESGSITSGGRQRTYRFHLPPAPAEGALPLLVALHGRLGQGKNQEQLSGVAALADREGFAVVYPDGIDRSWADDRGASPASKQG